MTELHNFIIILITKPGTTYLRILPTLEQKSGVLQTFSRNKLDFILKGKNTIVTIQKFLTSNATNVSYFNYSCFPN